MALSKEDVLEAIADMSVMDVVQLVEAMEEKFGVSAAAAVAAAAAAAPTSAGATVPPTSPATLVGVVGVTARGVGGPPPMAAPAEKAPLLLVPSLRLAVAFERLVAAVGVPINVALDLVPIGEDAASASSGDGVISLRPLLLLSLCSLALGLRLCNANLGPVGRPLSSGRLPGRFTPGLVELRTFSEGVRDVDAGAEALALELELDAERVGVRGLCCRQKATSCRSRFESVSLPSAAEA